MCLPLKKSFILPQSIHSGLQKIDLIQLLLRRFLKSDDPLQLFSLIIGQLQTFPNLSQTLGLLSDLFSQPLSSRHHHICTRQHTQVLKYKITYSKHGMTTQDPASNKSCPLRRLVNLLLQRLLQCSVGFRGSRWTSGLILRLDI